MPPWLLGWLRDQLLTWLLAVAVAIGFGAFGYKIAAIDDAPVHVQIVLLLAFAGIGALGVIGVRYWIGRRGTNSAGGDEGARRQTKADTARVRAEIEYNATQLENVGWATAPTLLDDVWRVVGARVTHLPPELWAAIDEVYREIRAAKAIHGIIRQAPPASNTMPEHLRLEEGLHRAKGKIDAVLERLGAEDLP